MYIGVTSNREPLQAELDKMMYEDRCVKSSKGTTPTHTEDRLDKKPTSKGKA